MTKPYRHPVPDEQTWAEAQMENISRSIVEWRVVAGGLSKIALDKNGKVLLRACRLNAASDRDPVLVAQDTIETGSQVVGADDEWA
ncbi:hypothetical protein ASD11_01455 [Aeromicrobium sp. Root495]|uniref:hypothetical protein n=1 Tax=Aeromicrobium sp. Root495 TaxID=1736550 RepID=UPI000700F8F1|nr:hypothetical protein [Aeromicrobium sp. Root495]KQY58362.1 hypothetical protein ASD11_01455 [Aeromicrobium sp. Root495]